jgi:hypothetical protein
VDAAGSIFVTNFGYPYSQPGTVNEYARGSGASSTPTAVFSGWAVYSYPYGITVVPGPI